MMTFLAQDEKTGYFTKAVDEHGNFVGNMINVHSEAACDGRGCAIHNHPSDHPLNTAPMLWHNYSGVLERICQHGSGHPDVDSAKFLESVGAGYKNVHGCDGCC